MAGQFPHDIGGVPTLIAKQINSGSSCPIPPPVEELAPAVCEVTIRTQIEGSSFVDVQIADPSFRLINHGFLTLVPSGPAAGLLDAIKIEFPVGSGSYWVLAAVDISNDQSQANITATFEDYIIWELRQHWGQLGPRNTTVLQFIQTLMAEVPSIDFVCPALGLLKDDSKPATTPGTRNPNKQPGVDKATPLTSSLTSDQASNINRALAVAKSLNAPLLAMQALLCAGFGESNWQSGQSNGTYGGVLGGSIATFPDTSDPGPETSSFLLGGNGYQSGGAIFLANQYAQHPNPLAAGYIAARVEGSAVPGSDQAYSTVGNAGQALESGAQYYQNGVSKSSPGGTSPTPLEMANEILSQSGYSVTASGAAQSTSPNSNSDAQTAGQAGPSWMPVSQFERGGQPNPGEDSWDCVQRLIQDTEQDLSYPGLPLGTGTTWYSFSNVDAFYVMDGHEMIAQMPAAYIDVANNVWQATSATTSGSKDKFNTDKHYGDIISLSGTWDNTAFIYASTKKANGVVERKSRTAKPSTPTELTLELVCGIDEFRAGQSFYISNFGPANGKWIVVDATRNCMNDTFTTFTLEPPVDQNDSSTVQNQAVATHAASTNAPQGQGVNTDTAGVAAASTSSPSSQPAASAMRALAEKSKFTYQEIRPMPASLFGTKQEPGYGVPFVIDCSTFVTLCYKDVNWPDPNNLNYNGQGYTGTLYANATKVTNPQVNDLCFYGGSTSTIQHVTIYVGNGQVVSMGEEGDPSIGPAAEMGPASLLGYWRPNTGQTPTLFGTSTSLTAPIGTVTPNPGYNSKPKAAAPTATGLVDSAPQVGVSSPAALAAAGIH